MLYSKRKEKIYGYYNKYKKINIDNIQEVNDTIIDRLLKQDDFNNDQEEFYNTLSMCKYMIDNNLFDECFFVDYTDLREEYKNFIFTDEEDKKLLDSDMEDVNEYLRKDKKEKEYYDKLSEVYNDKLKNKK